MKRLLVVVTVFLVIISAGQSFGLGYTSDEGGSDLKKSENPNLESEKRQTLPKQAHQESAKKMQPDSSGRYSENVNGYEVHSNNPINVLPPSSGGTITVQGNETIVRPNSSGGIQAVGGGDIFIVPNK
ncbi:MAG: hypothetical protein WC682_00660 [Parcubacteria group bacterium]|jgi:hypothetical protein